jgi:YesN/AraC family two-component response regulator
VSPYSQSFGIGLAYARDLAELHGGTLTLGECEKYTEFILRLPLKDIPTGEYVEENLDEVVKRSDLPLALVVEDNVGLLTYLKKNLKQEYNVMGVQSAEKALTLLMTYKADIIITDIALQGMSGVELCQKVNSSSDLNHIPIIVVSAISSIETKMKCMESGATNYIEKPYSMDYLKACIKSALNKKATIRATYVGSNALADLPDSIISRDEDFVMRLEKIVAENLSNASFSSTQLGEQLFMGHSTLNRKMKALFDTTPNDYIRSKRLAKAAEMLEKGNHRVSEVCYAIGFNSPSYFAKCFKREYGVLPAEWGKKNDADAEK